MGPTAPPPPPFPPPAGNNAAHEFPRTPVSTRCEPRVCSTRLAAAVVSPLAGPRTGDVRSAPPVRFKRHAGTWEGPRAWALTVSHCWGPTTLAFTRDRRDGSQARRRETRGKIDRQPGRVALLRSGGTLDVEAGADAVVVAVTG